MSATGPSGGANTDGRKKLPCPRPDVHHDNSDCEASAACRRYREHTSLYGIGQHDMQKLEGPVKEQRGNYTEFCTLISELPPLRQEQSPSHAQ